MLVITRGYHHLPVFQGVCSNPSINQPMGRGHDAALAASRWRPGRSGRPSARHSGLWLLHPAKSSQASWKAIEHS